MLVVFLRRLSDVAACWNPSKGDGTCEVSVVLMMLQWRAAQLGRLQLQLQLESW